MLCVSEIFETISSYGQCLFYMPVLHTFQRRKDIYSSASKSGYIYSHLYLNNCNKLWSGVVVFKFVNDAYGRKRTFLDEDAYLTTNQSLKHIIAWQRLGTLVLRQNGGDIYRTYYFGKWNCYKKYKCLLINRST